jgi:hypothetical protein
MENQTTPTETVHPLVAQTKTWRRDLDAILQQIKAASVQNPPPDYPAFNRSSRERSTAITKVQEAIMWLGMDLKAMSEEGIDGCSNPYPQSKNPQSPVIEPTADGLKL